RSAATACPGSPPATAIATSSSARWPPPLRGTGRCETSIHEQGRLMTERFDCAALVFGPHPDDVELFCGGIVIRLVDLGHRTVICDLTRGERASHGTPDERARETEAASAILGIATRENLGLPDAGIDATAPAQLAATVGAIRRLRPEIVLIP